MPAPPDGGSPDGPPGAPATITLHPPEDLPNLKLIAFRDGPDEPWQMPTATGAGSYEITVHGPYTVEHVCAAPSFAWTFAVSRTPDDPHDLDLRCLSSGAAPMPDLSSVEGSVTTPAVVSVGNASSLASDRSFDVLIPDGTYDLIARTPDGWVVIRRNLVVAGNTRVTPDIDVAAEGTVPILVNPTVNSSVIADVIVSYLLTTPAASLSAITPHGEGVYVLPDSALRAGDAQSIKVDALSTTETVASEWVISRRYTAGTSMVFNPPEMTIQHATIGGQLVLTWMPVRSFDEVQLVIEQPENSAGVSVEHTVDLSASYVAATGIAGAAFDTDLPGYDPAWRTAYSLPWGMSTRATWTEGGDTISVDRGEVVTP
jgi:hypothetical protein